MRAASLVLGLFAAATLSSACHAQIFDDPFSQYFERGITITPGAGNAKDANAAIHTIDPWPPYAGYTRLPGNGRESVGAVERMYRQPSPFAGAASGVGVVGGSTAGASGIGTLSGSTGVSTGGMQAGPGGY